MKKMVLFLLLALSAGRAFSRILLNVNIIHRKGIDTGLVLLGELHAKEEVFRGRPVILGLKDGPRVEINAGFVNDISDYGPSADIAVVVGVASREGGAMVPVDGYSERAVVPIGQKGDFRFMMGDSEMVEIAVAPEMR